MLKFRLGVIFAAVVLTGCDHHKSSSQYQPETSTPVAAKSDSDATGKPEKKAYPRALPVSSPAISEATPPGNNNDTAASSSSSSGSPRETSPADKSSTPADGTSSSSTPPASPAPDTSTAATPAESAPTPAPAPAPSPDTTQLAMNISTPAPDSSSASQEQVVVLQTSMGQIVIQLDNFAAPKTCENFRKLVSDGFYNHTVFHRVIPNFVIQGGDPSSKTENRSTYGQGGPGYTVPAEIKLKHDRGAVAMARLPDSLNPQRESNGSQFYICVAPCPSLDDQYTVFGHVIRGMDVAAKIANQPRDKRDNPLNRIEMEASLEPKGRAMEEGSTVNP